jgi:hypothetical protein
MNEISILKHRFVGEVPEELSTGILYVSLEFDTMVHLCCCGCGQEIVTPLSPTDWRFTYDGAAVTVHPSIGNWSYQCRSHYIIRNGRVIWVGDWTSEQVTAGRARDRAAKAAQFETKSKLPQTKTTSTRARQRSSGILARLWRYFRR